MSFFTHVTWINGNLSSYHHFYRHCYCLRRLTCLLSCWEEERKLKICENVLENGKYLRKLEEDGSLFGNWDFSGSEWIFLACLRLQNSACSALLNSASLALQNSASLALLNSASLALLNSASSARLNSTCLALLNLASSARPNSANSALLNSTISSSKPRNIQSLIKSYSF